MADQHEFEFEIPSEENYIRPQCFDCESFNVATVILHGQILGWHCWDCDARGEERFEPFRA